MTIALMLLLEIFTLLDFVAVGSFVSCWIGYEIFLHFQTRKGRSLPSVMEQWRATWMEEVVPRDNRILDIQIIRSLTGNSSFLASTAILVIGGLMALLGAADQAVEVLNNYEYFAVTNQDRFGLKVAFLIVIFMHAFFRLAWSMRLHNNAAIILGAIPQPDQDPEGDTSRRRAGIAAKLVQLASVHYNGGMHSYYFGLAASAWFIHPVALMASSVWVVLIVHRREFRSRALHAALGK